MTFDAKPCNGRHLTMARRINTATYFVVVLLTFSVFSLLQSSVYDASFELRTPSEALRESFVQAGHSGEDEVHDDPDHLAGLSCERYGGPSPQYAQEMIYWQDIPADSQHMSPLHRNHPLKGDNPSLSTMTEYLTFEPDRGESDIV
jgi:hypothetical protein